LQRSFVNDARNKRKRTWGHEVEKKVILGRCPKTKQGKPNIIKARHYPVATTKILEKQLAQVESRSFPEAVLRLVSSAGFRGIFHPQTVAAQLA
jgi:hypothetical protein